VHQQPPIGGPGLRVFDPSGARSWAAAARGAITGLPYAPVMFELGARPHPARELDRAYLAQTEVFAGIYRGLHACVRGASTRPVELGHDRVAGSLSPACRLGGHGGSSPRRLN